jgi:hypothetical protein
MTGLSFSSFQRKLESRGVRVGDFVSEQRSEALFAAKEIALSPSTPRNDKTPHLLMKSESG